MLSASISAQHIAATSRDAEGAERFPGSGNGCPDGCAAMGGEKCIAPFDSSSK